MNREREQGFTEAARDTGAGYYAGGSGLDAKLQRVSNDACFYGTTESVRRALAVLGVSFGERVPFDLGYQQSLSWENVSGRLVVSSGGASADLFYALTREEPRR